MVEVKLNIRECLGCGGSGAMMQYSPSGKRIGYGPCIICDGSGQVRVGKAEDVLMVGSDDIAKQTMRCISLKQPWANMIADGEKTIETRTWWTKYRGPIAIASSKMPNIHPAGCVVAIAVLVDCRPMIFEDEDVACCKVYPDAYSWVLTDVEKIEPRRVKGSQGIYTIDLDSLPLLEAG
jgi:hypothetical protein